MKLIDAAERVHSLATYGALENADQVLPEDAAGQREAIALFEDMIVNHWEEIEEHYAAGIEALERLVESPTPEAGAIDKVARESQIGASVSLVIENASRCFDAEAEGLNRRSINMFCAFWIAHGEDIAARMRVIPMGLDI